MRQAADILNELHCPFIINQNRYSIFDRTIEKNGILSSAIEAKKGMIIFSPLAQGLLTNRYLHGIPADSRVRTDGRFLSEASLTPALLQKIRALSDVAKERGQTLAQMALSWVYSREGITSVLIGASNPKQILENLGMQKNTVFTEEELQRIDGIALA
jgi:L-glyceraldehyde 3-phosphate reductase